MLELTDTHCHIQSIGQGKGERTTSELWTKLDKDIKQVVTDASGAGVSRLILVGCTLEDSQLAIDTVAKFESAWASIGIHPHEAKDYAENEAKKQQFGALVGKPKVVAIGECGLDYYYKHSDPESQQKMLEFQLELADRHNLPVIFHVREAFDDFWPIFDSFKNIRGVLHSFTDSMDNLHRALERGLYIGVNGIATFTKDAAQTAMYKAIPIDNLLLETDAPFLTPSPLRGSINEPKNVRLVGEYMASLRGETKETISSKTTENAFQLFNIN